ncbi:hypothetical protein [Streptomyces chartreusis]|uniref:hypothetical protein n=1 Tax=Streptomyces chartreusis TaxID=1969 RepID=UPI00367DDA72
MACPSGNPVANVIVGFFSFLGNPVGTIIQTIANAILAAAIAVFGELTTSIPTLETGGAAQDISSQTQWIVVYGAVGSLIFAAFRMTLERRGDAGQVALKGILRLVLVAGGATAVMTALASLSDRYADHLFRAGAQEQLTSIGCADNNQIEAFLLLVLAFLLLIAAIIHTILLYIRLGVMILLLGTLPLAAAASMTDWGSGWWRKHIGWMIAWLLYKPAAGLVMYAGSAMISNGPESGVHERIAGIGVMLLSAVALPALLKLVVPATAALGGAAAMQRGTMTAAGAVASGAKSLGGASSSALLTGVSSTAKDHSGGGGPQGAVGAAGANGGAGPGGRGFPGSGGGDRGGSPSAAGVGRGAGAGAGVAQSAGAAGPAGAVVGATVSLAKGVGKVAAGAIDGADGNAGHNR